MAMTAAGMAQKIEAALTAAGYFPNNTIPNAVITALCQGILNEITANSELVPITQDSGTAGAGIITGKVK